MRLPLIRKVTPMTQSTPSTFRATVCLTIDFDAVSVWLQWGARGLRALSRGEFGATVGVPRLLSLLARKGIDVTWFIPGHTVDTWPDLTTEIARCGYEIGNHGYLHDSFDDKSPAECREILRKTNAAIERTTGTVPVGFRAPAGDVAGDFLEILLSEGFRYDSSLLGNDFSPYWCRSRDEIRADGPLVFGDPIDLVEMPFTQAMNDFHHFEFSYGAPLLIGHDAPSSVEEIWTGTFDYMYEHVPGGILNVTCHPQSIGHGMRMAMLERWIDHCLAHPGTRFARVDTVAEEFRLSQASLAPTPRASDDGPVKTP
jgi:peptidoglycan/xylan/chitin deacetylase (PgdA/CDA1 family)